MDTQSSPAFYAEVPFIASLHCQSSPAATQRNKIQALQCTGSALPAACPLSAHLCQQPGDQVAGCWRDCSMLHAGTHLSTPSAPRLNPAFKPTQIIRLELIEHNTGADDANKTKESLNVLRDPLPNGDTMQPTTAHAFAGGRKTPQGLRLAVSGNKKLGACLYEMKASPEQQGKS